jgi:hypothetical protein
VDSVPSFPSERFEFLNLAQRTDLGAESLGLGQVVEVERVRALEVAAYIALAYKPSCAFSPVGGGSRVFTVRWDYVETSLGTARPITQAVDKV